MKTAREPPAARLGARPPPVAPGTSRAQVEAGEPAKFHAVKTGDRGRSRSQASQAAKAAEIAGLRARLAETEATLLAIRSGEADTLVVAGLHGPRVFTLEGAGHAYQVLIESMNEGALTLTPDKTILYANQGFARMVKCPLEQVTGSSFRRFISNKDRALFRPLLLQADPAGSKLRVSLLVSDGSHLPVQLSMRPLAPLGAGPVTTCLVVTDLTEARRIEELLRALTHRAQQVQEDDRVNVAFELHDHITQLLCAILFRCQALVDVLSGSGGPSLKEAMQLREMLSQTAREVERISRNLRPGVLDQLGLGSVLRATCVEFSERVGIPVELTCAPLTVRLPADFELTLYRILQEALKNVEIHARARHVTVRLSLRDNELELLVKDDGMGFEPDSRLPGRKTRSGLGLVGIRERAAYMGGHLEINSARRAGTEIIVRLPLPAAEGGGARGDEQATGIAAATR